MMSEKKTRSEAPRAPEEDRGAISPPGNLDDVLSEEQWTAICKQLYEIQESDWTQSERRLEAIRKRLAKDYSARGFLEVRDRHASTARSEAEGQEVLASIRGDVLTEEERSTLQVEADQLVADGAGKYDEMVRISQPLHRHGLARSMLSPPLARAETILREVGTPEEVESNLAALHQVQQAVTAVIGMAKKDASESMGAPLNLSRLAIGSEQEQRILDALATLQTLFLSAQADSHTAMVHIASERDGLVWKFDESSRRLVQAGAGNAPRHYFTEAVRDICEFWRVSGNTKRVRERIAYVLAGRFPPESLDPRRGGPIGVAVGSYLAKLSRAETEERRKRTD